MPGWCRAGRDIFSMAGSKRVYRDLWTYEQSREVQAVYEEREAAKGVTAG